MTRGGRRLRLDRDDTLDLDRDLVRQTVGVATKDAQLADSK